MRTTKDDDKLDVRVYPPPWARPSTVPDLHVDAEAVLGADRGHRRRPPGSRRRPVCFPTPTPTPSADAVHVVAAVIIEEGYTADPEPVAVVRLERVPADDIVRDRCGGGGSATGRRKQGQGGRGEEREGAAVNYTPNEPYRM